MSHQSTYNSTTALTSGHPSHRTERVTSQITHHPVHTLDGAAHSTRNTETVRVRNLTRTPILSQRSFGFIQKN